jgi:O-antigen/teichoic acid export membrane protein
MKINWVVAKNALANLGRGVAAGIAALFLPPILVRHMSQLDYTLWVLVLQIAAYASYLDFGLQTAIGRYVAFANEKKDPELRDGIFSTAFLVLSGASLISILLILAVGSAAHRLFPQIPVEVLPQMRVALFILGSSVAIGLPASAWSGVFVGLHKNEVPAIVIGASKILSAVALAAIVWRGHSIVVMAVVMALFNVFSYIMLFIFAGRVVPEIRFHRSLVRWSSARELAGYCSSLTIWSFAMMLVTGLDLLLVGHFQISALASYAVAASMVTVIAGAQSAIFSAMIPHAAVMQVRASPVDLGRMVITSTRIGILLLVISAAPLLIYGEPIMRLWAGQSYAANGYQFLRVLLFGNIIRLVGTPYSAILVGTGQQRLVTVSPIAEGLTNLIASLILGYKLGAIGVAMGTVIGGFVGILAHVFYNVPRTSAIIRLGRRDFMVSGIGLPLLTIIPILLVGGFGVHGARPSPLQVAYGAGASILLGALLMFGNSTRMGRT